MEDIAALALFLASEGAKYINGAVIPLDGGMRNRTLPVHAVVRLLDAEDRGKLFRTRD
jgi:NAD(P)-dependent dehydrogenase (short-subunit alcohol dehydrogenase family)